MKQSMLWCGVLGLAIAGCSLDLGGGKPKPDTSTGDDEAGDDESDESEAETSAESDDGQADDQAESSGVAEESGDSGSELDPVWDCWCAADCDGRAAEWVDFVCAAEIDEIDEAVLLAVDTCTADLDPQCDEFVCECECELVPDEVCAE